MKRINGYKLPTIVKWAGGKAQLLNQFKQFFPNRIENYYEPFLGSGAVFFYVKQRFKPEKAIISDNNQDLINTYIDVRDNVQELISKLEEHKTNHSKKGKSYFYKIRNEFNSGSEGVERSAQLIYLNKTCFNGLYRVNSKGEFNVPFGHYKKPAIVDRESLLFANKLLQGITIKCQDFKDLTADLDKEFFIYFDPPYVPLNANSFTSYTKDDFGLKDQEELADLYKKLSNNHKVMLSNSYTQTANELYKEYNKQSVLASRMINCVGSNRGKIKELVVTNYKTKQEKIALAQFY